MQSLLLRSTQVGRAREPLGPQFGLQRPHRTNIQRLARRRAVGWKRNNRCASFFRSDPLPFFRHVALKIVEKEDSGSVDLELEQCLHVKRPYCCVHPHAPLNSVRVALRISWDLARLNWSARTAAQNRQDTGFFPLQTLDSNLQYNSAEKIRKRVSSALIVRTAVIRPGCL